VDPTGQQLAPLTGDEPADEALERLIDEQGGRLYALGRRFCGNESEAEDLVQETFLTAFRRWETFEGKSDVATWLYTIAARVCQRFHRKRAGEPNHMESIEDLLPIESALMPSVPEEDDPLAVQVRREARERLEAAIGALPTDFRMPLVLKELVGLSVADVAAVLGLPANTVKTRLHRARLRLRKALDEVLPQVEGPPAAYSTQVCLDLLSAKQEALDRGQGDRLPGEVICIRCNAIFATLDLSGALCRELAAGDLPPELREALAARIAAETRQ
jgi:RNA polymerase sigma-70 factor (ECF subfamily)